MNKKITNILKSLENLDWKNFERSSFQSQKVLQNLFDDRKLIGCFLESVLKNKHLISLAEHYDFFDKVVLYVDKKDRFRIRIHIFSDDNSNVFRPHCHRWIYSSVILQGSYEHFIYGTEDQINETTDIKSLNPVMSQQEKMGSIYTLNYNVFHSIKAEPNTASLMIRGPAVKDRFLIIDKKANKVWWEYGRESETTEEIEKKSISTDYLEKLINKIYKMKIA